MVKKTVMRAWCVWQSCWLVERSCNILLIIQFAGSLKMQDQYLDSFWFWAFNYSIRQFLFFFFSIPSFTVSPSSEPVTSCKYTEKENCMQVDLFTIKVRKSFVCDDALVYIISIIKYTMCISREPTLLFLGSQSSCSYVLYVVYNYFYYCLKYKWIFHISLVCGTDPFRAV